MAPTRPVPHRRAPAALLAAILFLVLAAACAAPRPGSAAQGTHEHGEHAAAPVEGAREVRIVARDSTFSPSVITLTAGEPVNVVLDNVDPLHHDVALTEVDFLLGADGGETATGALVIDEPGTYEAICSVPGHADAGMVLAVEVQAP
jgi:uncharacterized cupredoxin-like copper-binding protein